MRKFIFFAIISLTVFFVITNFTEVQSISDTIQNGDWRFLLLALIVEFLWLLNIALSYKFIFRSLGLNERIPKLLILSSAANFINVVAPTGGIGGMAVLIDNAKQKGDSSGRTTVAGVLFVLLDYIGFLIVLTLGLIVLFRRNNLGSAELTASAILFIVALIMATLLVIGMNSPRTLSRIFYIATTKLNQVFISLRRKKRVSAINSSRFAYEIANGLKEIRRKPERLIIPAGLALSSKLLLICILLLMFFAFDVSFSVGTIIAGFSIGYLFFVVSPTPAGLGIVEGALTLGLVSLNVPLNQAAAVTLAYRGVTFWVPLLIGVLSFRMVSGSKKIDTAYTY